MPFSINDVLQVRPICTYAAQTAFNILHAQVTAQVGLGATEAEIATAVSLDWAGVYKPMLTTGATYYGIGIRKISPGTPGFEFYSNNGSGAGTVAGDSCPKQVSGVVTLISTLPGRKGRGRAFIPFVSEGSNGPTGIPVAGYLTTLNNWGLIWMAAKVVNSIINPGASTTINYGIWSPTLSLFNLKNTYSVRGIWGTQRRRGDFGKANIPPF